MKYINERTIHRKISRCFILLVFIALLVSNILIITLLGRIYKKQLLDSYQNIAENISGQIDDELNSVRDLAQVICSDDTLQNLIHQHNSYHGYMFYRITREISSSLGKFVTLKDDLIDDIYYLDELEQVISGKPMYDDTADSSWYREFLERRKNSGYVGVHEVTQKENNSLEISRDVVTYITAIYDIEDYAEKAGEEGHILMNIKADALFEEADSFPDFSYTVITEDGESVCGNIQLPDLTLPTPKKETVSLIHGSNHYFICPIPDTGWLLVSEVSFSRINEKMYMVALIASLICVLMMIAAAVVIRVVSRTITEPLNELTERMEQFSGGDFEVHAQISSGDEVEKISHVFNEMVDSIRFHMEESIRREKEKKESEISFLMAQIKPHFIYNSLNCIIYLARQKRTDDIVLYTRTFISVLQASIKKKPQEKVTILSEIEFLKNYLTLFRYRYDNVPELIPQIDADCEQLHIPAMILLPLVENSMFHGASGKPEEKIWLIVCKKGEQTEIHVKDNGCGISQSRLEQLRENLKTHRKSEEQREHIGLENVNERLRLCFGEEQYLHLESVEGEGTDAWFSVS